MSTTTATIASDRDMLERAYAGEKILVIAPGRRCYDIFDRLRYHAEKHLPDLFSPHSALRKIVPPGDGWIRIVAPNSRDIQGFAPDHVLVDQEVTWTDTLQRVTNIVLHQTGRTPQPLPSPAPSKTRDDELAERRRERDASYDGHTCPACGDAWFETTAITVTRDLDTGTLSPTGYAHPLRCRTCGHAQP